MTRLTTTFFRLLPAALLVVSACGGLNVQQNYQAFRPYLLNRDFASADKYVASVKQSFYKKKSRLLYFMDRAMTLHLAGDYKGSNEALENAKATAQELWTDSIGENAAAWLTTDNAISYQGEDFEKVALHFLAACNYIELGDLSSARVEARQLYAKLNVYNDKYDSANRYRDDAFARYLSGKLFMSERTFEELQNARLEFDRALEVYGEDYAKRYNMGLPPLVVEDTLATYASLGADFRRKFRALKKRYAGQSFPAPKRFQEEAEVVFVHMNGEAPYKRDQFWTAPAGPTDIVRIAYPEFVRKIPLIQGARLRVGDAKTQTQLVQDFASIAIENLDDHLGRIKTKAIARSVAKFLAAKALKEAGKKQRRKNNKGAGAALWLTGAVLGIGSAIAEEADKRSWVTLPAEVRMGRLFVPPGQHQLDVDFVDLSGAVIEHASFDLDVVAGQTKFVMYRTFR